MNATNNNMYNLRGKFTNNSTLFAKTEDTDIPKLDYTGIINILTNEFNNCKGVCGNVIGKRADIINQELKMLKAVSKTDKQNMNRTFLLKIQAIVTDITNNFAHIYSDERKNMKVFGNINEKKDTYLKEAMISCYYAKTAMICNLKTNGINMENMGIFLGKVEDERMNNQLVLNGTDVSFVIDIPGLGQTSWHTSENNKSNILNKEISSLKQYPYKLIKKDTENEKITNFDIFELSLSKNIDEEKKIKLKNSVDMTHYKIVKQIPKRYAKVNMNEYYDILNEKVSEKREEKLKVFNETIDKEIEMFSETKKNKINVIEQLKKMCENRSIDGEVLKTFEKLFNLSIKRNKDNKVSITKKPDNSHDDGGDR